MSPHQSIHNATQEQIAGTLGIFLNTRHVWYAMCYVCHLVGNYKLKQNWQDNEFTSLIKKGRISLGNSYYFLKKAASFSLLDRLKQSVSFKLCQPSASKPEDQTWQNVQGKVTAETNPVLLILLKTLLNAIYKSLPVT